MVMQTSLPMMQNAAWDITSGITGFTLPGRMEEPFCFAGRLISWKPQRGPEDIRRKSFAILEQEIAQVFSEAET